MPELPEVETMRRAVLPAVGGRIVRVALTKSNYRPIQLYPKWPTFRRRLEGRTIRSVDRLGKRVALQLDRGSTLILQPKMAGIVIVGNPPSMEHVRVVFHLENCNLSSFLYWDRRGLGSIQLFSASELEERLGPNVLGPDALVISFADFLFRLSSGRTPIKVALMDQQKIAGIGNMYASEILFRAKVHPCRTCTSVSATEWKRIYSAMRRILSEAIQLEGSTLSDGTYLKSLDSAGQYQSRLQVYDRGGELCKRCRSSAVQRIRQAQRSTYFCPTCQITS